MKRRNFVQGALAASAVALAAGDPKAAPAPSLTGMWRVVIGRLDNGEDFLVYYDLKQDGETITGTSTSMGASDGFRKIGGRIVGDRFTIENAGLPINGTVAGDTLTIEANYDKHYYWAFPQSDPKVPVNPAGTLRKFIGRRIAADAVHYPPRKSFPTARQVIPPNGLGKTPQMLWGAWYGFSTAISDSLIREIAQAMVSTGLRDAGYDIVNLEVGWTGRRDANGNLGSNSKFPDMKALGDYIHSLGLKFGICTSPGPFDCTGYPASYGYEEQDAKTFARWGIDYIKHDQCSASLYIDKEQDSRLLYQRMGAALQSCGRPIYYALCQYGLDEVWKWGPEVGANSWRTTGDSQDNWKSMTHIGFGQEPLAPYAGPGHWNDPDYLMAGLGRMTNEEYRTQMSLWCMLAAPLSIAPDLRKLSAETSSILMNRHIIAIDQDRLGHQARRVARSGDLETWARPLQNGAHAVALFNRGDAAAAMSVDFGALGLPVRKEALDVWSSREMAIVDGVYRVEVPRHGSVVIRI